MPGALQPPPYQSAQGSTQWLEWYRLINEKLQAVSGSIGEITDVTITGAETGDFLVYNSSNVWANQTIAQVVETLGFDTGDSVVFNSVETETAIITDAQITDATLSAELDVEGNILVVGNLDVEGVLTTPVVVRATTNPILNLDMESASATIGPVLRLYRDSSSPADNDVVGAIRFTANTDDGAGGVTSSDVIYGRIRGVLLDTTDTEKDFELTFGTRVDNTLANRWNMHHGFYAAGLTDQGQGTVNAEGFYIDNSAIGLDSLADVTQGTPSDEDVLTWNDSSEVWEAQSIPSVSILSDVGDVETETESQSDEQVLTWNDSAEVWEPQDSAGGSGAFAAATAIEVSGETADFTGLPADVQVVYVSLDNISFTGNDDIWVQLGDSGGFETTGYVSASDLNGTPNSTTSAFNIALSNNAVDFSGVMVLTKLTGNLWTSSHNGVRADTVLSFGGGTKTLSGALTQIRVTASGGSDFDAGDVNISYGVTATAASAGWTYGSQTATTSGTSVTLADDVDFSAATEIEIIFNGVSTTGASQPPIVRIGPTGGVVSSGYVGKTAIIAATSAGHTAVTDGFYAARAGNYAAADTVQGVMRLTRWDTSEHYWMAEIHSNMNSGKHFYCGEVTLAGALTDIVLTTPGGSATFDLGEARYRYR